MENAKASINFTIKDLRTYMSMNAIGAYINNILNKFFYHPFCVAFKQLNVDTSVCKLYVISLASLFYVRYKVVAYMRFPLSRTNLSRQNSRAPYLKDLKSTLHILQREVETNDITELRIGSTA